jgi:hypothetical protein
MVHEPYMWGVQADTSSVGRMPGFKCFMRVLGVFHASFARQAGTSTLARRPQPVLLGKFLRTVVTEQPLKTGGAVDSLIPGDSRRRAGLS